MESAWSYYDEEEENEEEEEEEQEVYKEESEFNIPPKQESESDHYEPSPEMGDLYGKLTGKIKKEKVPKRQLSDKMQAVLKKRLQTYFVPNLDGILRRIPTNKTNKQL